jgi:chromosome segregation ATPase
VDKEAELNRLRSRISQLQGEIADLNREVNQNRDDRDNSSSKKRQLEDELNQLRANENKYNSEMGIVVDNEKFLMLLGGIRKVE